MPPDSRSERACGSHSCPYENLCARDLNLGGQMHDKTLWRGWGQRPCSFYCESQFGGSSRRGRWRIGWRERHPLLPCTPAGSHLGLVISISGRSSLRFVSPGSVVLRVPARLWRRRRRRRAASSPGASPRRRDPFETPEEGTDRPGGVGLGVVSTSFSSTLASVEETVLVSDTISSLSLPT